MFVIRTLLEEQDWSAFEAAYKPGGRPPYSPRAMMGLILYGIFQGQNSLRELEYLARVDLGCWWCSGGTMPDHFVIGRFVQQHAVVLSGDPHKESILRQFSNEAVRQRYQKRSAWVEPVFSQLKGKQRLTRFRRKNLASVRLEFTLHALAIATHLTLKALIIAFRVVIVPFSSYSNFGVKFLQISSLSKYLDNSGTGGFEAYLCQ